MLVFSRTMVFIADGMNLALKRIGIYEFCGAKLNKSVGLGFLLGVRFEHIIFVNTFFLFSTFWHKHRVEM